MRIAKPLLPFALTAVCLALLLALIPALRTEPRYPATHLAKSALAQGSTHFAIADFDGDLRPDLAMIRVRQDGVPDAHYSLELQFSSGYRAPIGLIGPAGGLNVSPQDVNGDQIADLVITSVVDSEFIAILLNDGKGNFTQVDSAAYPGVGRSPHSRLLSPMESTIHEFAVSLSQRVFSDDVASTRWEHRPQVSSVLGAASAQISPNSALFHSFGRAPPPA